MRLDEIDVTLERLRPASDVIGANLLELERDPNRKLLETATLTGVTKSRWEEATRSLANIWECFTRLQDLLTRATGVRGPRARISSDRVIELNQLLAGPS